MRRRILLLVLATTSFALLLLGVLLVAAIWGATGSAAQDRVDSTAALTASTIDEEVRADLEATGSDEVSAATVAAIDTLVRAVAANSRTVISATLPGGVTVSSGTTEGQVWSATALEPLASVTAQIPVSEKVAQVAGQALLVVVIGLVALAFAMATAWFYTRRLLRPFDDFRDFVASVATGARRRLKDRYGIPEIDMVADVLDAGVTRFDSVIDRERQATQDASHQLKSPLTAISLRLDEIMTTDSLDEARDEAAVAQSQVERLAGVVDELVGHMRGQRLSMPVDVALMTLVDQQVEEWAPSFRAAGRAILVDGREDVVVHAEPGAQEQVLATLLENSLAHGAGTTTVRVRRASGWAVIEVADEGAGIPAELADRVFERTVSGSSSSGLGLNVARTLVAADGGRLELLSARPARFAVFLPAVEPERAPVGNAAVATESGADAERQALVETAASSAASGSSGNTQRR